MKAVILAGGYGTRLGEETHLKPKPMVEIGGKPILWHIMKIYSHYGINEFIICCGYKAELIQKYVQKLDEPWTVIPVDTGINTMTGGRLKLVKKYVENEPFWPIFPYTWQNIFRGRGDFFCNCCPKTPSPLNMFKNLVMKIG